MDDLEKYTHFLFDGLEGYVYAPLKRSDRWDSEFFSWPNQKQELHDWIKTSSELGDVYLSPVVYSEKRAKKEFIKETQVAWVEFDGQEKIDYFDAPLPNLIVQTSSSTHLHCYWKIPDVSVEAAEDINLRLTYYLQADTSGWDSTQLLRPPTSTNYKPEYPQPFPVELTYLDTESSNAKRFDIAPVVKRPEVSTVELANLLDYKDITKERRFSLSVLNLINKETAKEPHRSSFLYKAAATFAEEGLSQLEIVSLLYHIDERIKKYTGRADQLQRLSQIANLAVHKWQLEDSIQTYSIKDILEHTEDLEWILPGLLHTHGLMILTAAPGVGKTQFSLQLVWELLGGTKFLGLVSSSSMKHSILFMSLEMDHRSLRYIVTHQSKEWTEFDQSKFCLIDEPANYTKYENLIEDLKPTVLIIDSLSEILESSGDSQGQAAEAIACMKWIRKIRRRYGVAVILIHHNRKGNDSNRKPKKLDDLAGSFHFARQTETAVCLWEDHKGIEFNTIKARFGPKLTFYIQRNQNLWFSRKEDSNANYVTRSDSTVDAGDGSIHLDFD